MHDVVAAARAQSRSDETRSRGTSASAPIASTCAGSVRTRSPLADSGRRGYSQKESTILSTQAIPRAADRGTRPGNGRRPRARRERAAWSTTNGSTRYIGTRPRLLTGSPASTWSKGAAAEAFSGVAPTAPWVGGGSDRSVAVLAAPSPRRGPLRAATRVTSRARGRLTPSTGCDTHRAAGASFALQDDQELDSRNPPARLREGLSALKSEDGSGPGIRAPPWR